METRTANFSNNKSFIFFSLPLVHKAKLSANSEVRSWYAVVSMCQQAAGTSSKLLFVLENYGLVERPLRACCKTDSKTTNGVNW